jgi:hypothetical protein
VDRDPDALHRDAGQVRGSQAPAHRRATPNLLEQRGPGLRLNAMMREIKESDWKLLRQLDTEAVERFCKQILLEIERINSDRAESFHQKYLDIYALLHRRDKEIAQTFDDLRRTTAFIHLASMKDRGLLTEDELVRFSQETQDVVHHLLGS